MLNLSHNSIGESISREKYPSLKALGAKKSGRVLLRLLVGTLALLILVMFLPWTQNIRARGKVTTLRPDQRPQSIPSVIAGRIERWFVKEGDFVKRGDTILFISEIKDEYFDPQLLSRTQQQLTAKEMAVKSYMEKVNALDAQIDALVRTSDLKLEQAQNKLKQARLKVISDSTDLRAAVVNEKIAQEQLTRMEELYRQGLRSLTDVETRRLAMQRAQASAVSAENKLLATRNEVLNAEVELTSVVMSYRDDIAKAESDKYATLSGMYDAEAVVTKLQNQYMNYSVRTGMYYIMAPQDGYVTRTVQSGIGETIKEGEEIVTIMPTKYDLAVEVFIEPVDLPLLTVGQPVRIQFDGWPAIVFSGWPNTSYGTYGGRVYGIDNFISDNGKYRILVAPDPDDHPWPEALRAGAGTQAQILLKDVPVGYEIWRRLNGFPPDYYKPAKPEAKPAK